VSSITLAPQTGEVGVLESLTVTVSPPSGSYSYVWSNLPSGCLSENTNALSCTPSDSYQSTVSVQVTNATDVVQSQNGPLTVDPALTVGPIQANPNPLVSGNTLTISVTVNGGVGPYTYNWGQMPPGCPTGTSNPPVSCRPGSSSSSTASDPISVVVSDQDRASGSSNGQVNITPSSGNNGNNGNGGGSNNGNNSNNNNGGNASLSNLLGGLGGLITIALILAIVLFVAVIITAITTTVTAVTVVRRLPPRPRADPGRRCSSCGAEVATDSKFCRACGKAQGDPPVK
jgi:hypothetical protein